MPFRRKTKRKPKRRRRRKTGYRSLVSNYAPSGVSVMRIANMRYVEAIDLSSSLGLLNSVAYSANNIFDPTSAIGGHQPMGHDTWLTLYNHYVVLGSKLTVKLAPKNVLSTSMVGCLLTDAEAPPYSNSSQYQEARKGVTRLISQEQSAPITLTSKFSAKKFFNVADVKDNVNRLGGVMGADPTEEAYFNIWVQSKDSSVIGANFTVIVQIDYIVAFSEPKDLQAS